MAGVFRHSIVMSSLKTDAEKDLNTSFPISLSLASFFLSLQDLRATIMK